MFIVAVTLGLLAVMGVYGLSATSADIRAAGHMREALQGQRAGEAALMMTAETLNPTVASGFVTQMNLGQGQAQNCLTAAPFTGNVLTRAAESCVRLDPSRMVTIANSTNPLSPWAVAAAPAQPGFTLQSFGNVANQPYITVEVTNPITSSPGANSNATYTTVTVTVFAQLKQAAGVPAETVVTGRGRLTVGPSLPSNGAQSNF